ncbi:MAG: sugar-binding protein [Bacteroidota bacterium]
MTAISDLSGQDIRIYNCFKTGEEINIDGIPSEKVWGNARWTEDFINIEGDRKPAPCYTTKVKMCYDDSCLYIFAYMQEPHIWAKETTRDKVIFLDNDFEVFIDPDGDSHNYAELEINAFGTEWDLLLQRPYLDGGYAISEFDIEGLLSAVKLYGTINDPSDRDSSWTIEIAIPFRSLKYLHNGNITPTAGNVWRINFSRVQWRCYAKNGEYFKHVDEKTKKQIPEDNWVWSPQFVIDMHRPEKWGYLVFCGTDTNDIIQDNQFRQKITGRNKNWIWMHCREQSDSAWNADFEKIRSAGFDAILLGCGPDILKRISFLAAMKGLEVHAWIWTLNCNDSIVISDHPEWYNVNRNGDASCTKPAYVGYYKWLCPSNKEAITYLDKKVEALSTVRELSGIHLDYIRYPDVILPAALQPGYGIVQDREYPGYDYCYCERCKTKFRAEYSIDIDTIADPAACEEWKEFRYRLVRDVVIRMQAVAGKYKKDLTAAVFPTPFLARKLVRQNWDKWPLDGVMPMLYQNFYNEDIQWIGTCISEGVDSITFPLYAGLYIPALTPDSLAKAIGTTRLNGAGGIAIFDFDALTDEHWKVIGTFLSGNCPE